MREVFVDKWKIGFERNYSYRTIHQSYLYCNNINDSLFIRFLVNNKIMLCRRDGRVVQGVALELLCRLLFTEGSNPSLSVSLNSPTLLNTIYQITILTIIPTGEPLFDRNYLFLITVVGKIQISERVKKSYCWSICDM